MIREALALTFGLALGRLVDSAPVRAVQRGYCRVKLRLVLWEISDVCDEIAHAMGRFDAPLALELTEDYVALANERDRLRVKLAHLL